MKILLFLSLSTKKNVDNKIKSSSNLERESSKLSSETDSFYNDSFFHDSSTTSNLIDSGYDTSILTSPKVVNNQKEQNKSCSSDLSKTKELLNRDFCAESAELKSRDSSPPRDSPSYSPIGSPVNVNQSAVESAGSCQVEGRKFLTTRIDESSCYLHCSEDSNFESPKMSKLKGGVNKNKFFTQKKQESTSNQDKDLEEARKTFSSIFDSIF